MGHPKREASRDAINRVGAREPVSRMVGRAELVGARPDLGPIFDAAHTAFPVGVTRSWWARMERTDPHDPLARQVLPSAEELISRDGDLDDPVGEQGLSPVPWLVRKHGDRVLLLLTKRCHVYCRYCFRRTFDPGDHADPDPQELSLAIETAIASGAREVILSGGDPLAVSDRVLFSVIDRLRAGGVQLIRIHSRAPITFPERVTDALVSGLRERRPVWLVVHTNHARELSADVDAGLAALVDAGLPVLNQSVLLRGVNDDVATLEALCVALVMRGIKPYYLHHTDAVRGNADFRVSFEDGLRLYAALRERLSGIALPRYVVDPPDGSGKIDVERYVTARDGDVNAPSR